VRTLQLIDGVDNQSPGLNFSLGNFLGAPDLDVKGVEIVQGASSAYYGPGAFNGVIAMETKNPFVFRGVAWQMRVGERGLNEESVRWADTWKNKDGLDYFALKVNAYALHAHDWEATNVSPVYGSSENKDNPGRYDAVNVYGDEYQSVMDFSTSTPWTYKGLGAFHRTGYQERDLVNYNTKNTKANIAAHWRLKPEMAEASPEFILAANAGGGTTVYQGDNRFSLKDILFYQGRIELRKKDRYFVRAYATGEDAGRSYDPYFTALKLQSDARSNEEWAKAYVQYWNQQINPKIDALGYPQLTLNPNWPGPVVDPTYSQLYLPYDYQGLTQWMEQYHDSLVAWHQQVEQLTNTGNANLPGVDEVGYYQPGSAAFQEAFQRITTAKNNQAEHGTLFSDRSSLIHTQGQYQWNGETWDCRIGANGRWYRPNTLGTIFSDENQRIRTYEYGVYAGGSKRWREEKWIATATARLDKNKNFDRIISPAASLVYQPKRFHFLRLSFSSALRNPTMADQYLNLNVGPAILRGNLNGVDSLITVDSFQQYRDQLNLSALHYFNLNPIKPERVKSIELGYRGVFFDHLYLDASSYLSQYIDFIGYSIGIDANFDATTGLINDLQVYRYATNASSEVITQGASVGIQYYWGEHLVWNGNYSWNQLMKSDPTDPIIPAFNTPRNKYNVGVTGQNLFTSTDGSGWGFQVNYKWIQGFLFEGSPQFTGWVDTYSLLDLQANYTFKPEHINVKIGASNALNNQQFQTYGGPKIGRMAYFSLAYDLIRNQ
jgi:iron complex outermembrane receptor protein